MATIKVAQLWSLTWLKFTEVDRELVDVLSIFLSEYPNKLSNYVLLVIISYKTINSEHNLFET